jgi:hypothetical protein
MESKSMKYIVKSALCFSFATLIGCGGGSGGSAEKPGLSEESESDEPELVLAFDNEPLGPDVFNILASEESLEQDFNPGEQIRSSWFMTLRYSDDTDLAEGESHLYDAKVYLSSDNEIDELDLELFTIECSFPETSEHACGRFASFITVYAPSNENVFSTTSVPIGKTLGLSDFEVDSTLFLDTIPKETNLIISACLRDEPDKCDTFSIGISLL